MECECTYYCRTYNKDYLNYFVKCGGKENMANGNMDFTSIEVRSKPVD